MRSIAHIQTAITQLLQETTSSTLGTTRRMRQTLLGIVITGSVVLRQVAIGLSLVEPATQAASHERQLRRTVADPTLTWAATYGRTIRRILAKHPPTHGWTVIIDESGHTDQFRVLMAALWYRGRAIPLAWVSWRGQVPHDQSYWVDTAHLLDLVQQVLPEGATVQVLADRAFGCPAFTDLVAAHGWRWVVRLQGQTRLQTADGRTQAVSTLVAAPKQWSRATGRLFKKQGWRVAHVMAYWRAGHDTPLIVASNTIAGLRLIPLYRKRSAIESLFRDWKSYGWQWEASQIRDLAHHDRLIVLLAYATLITLCFGDERAAQILAAAPQRGGRRPWAARDSLFQLGRQRLHERLWQDDQRPIVWALAHPDAPNWSEECWQAARPAGIRVWTNSRIGRREHRRAA